MAREKGATPGVCVDRFDDLLPFLEGSPIPEAWTMPTSCSCRAAGLSHAKELLIPASWENVDDLDPAMRAFYEYHAFLTEPWDGPAAIAATDGVSLLVGKDRNGLRPARWTILWFGGQSPCPGYLGSSVVL